VQHLGQLWQIWAKRSSTTFKGRFHYKEDYPNGNEEESYQESRQEEKEVADSGEALSLAYFVSPQASASC
jgi:hypothetical protein